MEEGASGQLYSCTSCMSACATATRWRLALTVYRRAPLYSLKIDAPCFESLIVAHCSSQSWKPALELIRGSPEFRISRQAAFRHEAQATAGKGTWRATVLVLARCRAASLELDLKMNGMLCESARRGGWQSAIALLSNLGSRRVVMDAVMYSSAMNSCRLQGKWQVAGSLLHQSTKHRQYDTIVSNTFLASTDCPWPSALSTVSEMRCAGCSADAISHNTLVAACKGTWPQAIACYENMQHLNFELDIAFTTVIDACVRNEQRELGLRVLTDARNISSSLRFWATAQLVDLRDLNACLADVLQEVRTPKLTAAEASKLWWATATLGLHHNTLLRQLERHSSQLSRFTLEELVSVAMGACTTDAGAQFLCALRSDVVSRANALECQEEVAAQEVLQQLVGILWALNFAVPASPGFYARLREPFRTLSALLDEGVSAISRPKKGGRAPSNFGPKSPVAVLTLPDRLVTAKPTGWEVYGDTKLQLLPFVQTVLGELSIHRDSEHAFGFLHRLDVPSSGLILSASTYSAFYDLQLQLACGRLLRDYVVLCHGHVPQRRKEVRARLRLHDMASAGAQGKASCTLFKSAARAWATPDIALSLVLIRILTGRLHQIRSHFAFFGHPTMSDSKYTTTRTFSSDLNTCPRNFVHRFHLSFEDGQGCRHLAFMPVPDDLSSCLKLLATLDGASAQGLESWISGQEQFWEEATSDGCLDAP